MQTTTSPPSDGDMVRVTTTKNKKISNEFCSVYKSNLSGGLTSLQDQSGGSGAGPLNCGVLAGAGVVCSHVGKLSLGKVLGVVL